MRAYSFTRSIRPVFATLLAGFIALSMLSATARASTEESFWKWFVANEQQLFEFESDRAAVLKALSRHLRLVNTDLTYEIGPIENGKREFVISAGGIQASFPTARNLYASEPRLSRWT